MHSSARLLKFQLDDAPYAGGPRLRPPPFDPATYYRDVATSAYFKALVILRHHIKQSTDDSLGGTFNAKNVDLFMMTSSVSSPMGPGSDSLAVPIQFGLLKTFLVDSAQFGFEPLLLQGFERLYCYLPSMRGEDPDDRHLNQFFHAEMEVAAPLEDLFVEIESYVRGLSQTLLSLPNICAATSDDFDATLQALTRVAASRAFPRVSFEEAYRLLRSQPGSAEFVLANSFGRNITPSGEAVLPALLGSDLPVWVTGFDRNMVPFYQKPDPNNPHRSLNADLIFPPLTDQGLGGEIVGSGQRQDAVKEMYESLARQHINPEPYEWYIDLRRQPGYRLTSGFGLGIERFIAWALAKRSIRDVSLYPRLKNVLTYP